MKPATVEFRIRNNEAWFDGFLLRLKNGAAFSFADYVPLTMEVKTSGDAPVPNLSLSTVGGTLSVDVDGGLSIAYPLDDDLAHMQGLYVHDIVGVDAGQPVVIVVGTVMVDQGVTY